MQAQEPGPNEDSRAVQERLDSELGVREWWTPINPRRPVPAKPRVTEDGLKIPDWWTDDEAESQNWLISQGVILE